MEVFIIGFIILVILVPIIYFIPIGFNKKEKFFVVGVSFLLAELGMLANKYLQIWQSVLILLLFAIIITYFFETRLKSRFANSNSTEKNSSTKYDDRHVYSTNDSNSTDLESDTNSSSEKEAHDYDLGQDAIDRLLSKENLSNKEAAQKEGEVNTLQSENEDQADYIEPTHESSTDSNDDQIGVIEDFYNKNETNADTVDNQKQEEDGEERSNHEHLLDEEEQQLLVELQELDGSQELEDIQELEESKDVEATQEPEESDELEEIQESEDSNELEDTQESEDRNESGDIQELEESDELDVLEELQSSKESIVQQEIAVTEELQPLTNLQENDQQEVAQENDQPDVKSEQMDQNLQEIDSTQESDSHVKLEQKDELPTTKNEEILHIRSQLFEELEEPMINEDDLETTKPQENEASNLEDVEIDSIIEESNEVEETTDDTTSTILAEIEKEDVYEQEAEFVDNDNQENDAMNDDQEDDQEFNAIHDAQENGQENDATNDDIFRELNALIDLDEEELEMLNEDLELDSNQAKQESNSQRQIVQNMLSFISQSRDNLPLKEYEELVLAFMNEQSSDQDYYAFAHLLIEQYILQAEYEKLVILLQDLLNKYSQYPLIKENLQYLLGKYS